jgi:hypothetical protein
MGCNAFSVDVFVGTVSQGRRSSPAGADANPGLMDLNPVGIQTVCSTLFCNAKQTTHSLGFDVFSISR